MAYHHQLQTSRFELKYIIDRGRAGAIRDFLRSYLVPDEHAPPDEAYGYHVQSLYMDSPSLALYHQTMNGLKNRFKLRIRFYNDEPGSPIFLEIKRRVTDVIRKQRAAVTRDGLRRLLSGRRPLESQLHKPSVKSASALQNFCSLCDEIGARGRVFICYMREAYVSPNSDQVRVTFDRQLFGSPYRPGQEVRLQTQGTRPTMGGVILELKFTDRFPQWMREMAQTFNLERCSVPKYCECIQAMGLHRKSALEIASGVGLEAL